LHLIYCVLQSLASLEFRYFSGRDFDLSTGLRIFANTGSTLTYAESAKANQSELVATFESFSNGVNKSLQGFFGIRLTS